jgi:hypothetical protein
LNIIYKLFNGKINFKFNKIFNITLVDKKLILIQGGYQPSSIMNFFAVYFCLRRWWKLNMNLVNKKQMAVLNNFTETNTENFGR